MMIKMYYYGMPVCTVVQTLTLAYIALQIRRRRTRRGRRH